MAWPDLQDYQEAVQNPQVAFSDPDLRSGQVAQDLLGLPRPVTGGFATVYRVRSATRDWAVRCFQKDFKDQQERYKRIGEYLNQVNLPYTVGFSFLAQGIRVRGQWFPVLKMEWVDGEPLNQYVQKALRDPIALKMLADRWAQMIVALERAGIAHGDLQHGNVLVINGDYKLIDYDGMYVPTLAGQFTSSHELGHRNYQHPRRAENHFDPRLDNFSAWVIYLSLLALSEQPQFWQKVQAGDEYLLLRKEDFDKPQTSITLGQLSRAQSDIGFLAKRFTELLQLDPLDVPPLSRVAPSAGGGTAQSADWLSDHLAAQASPSSHNGAAARSGAPWYQDPARASGPQQVQTGQAATATVPASHTEQNAGWILDALSPPQPPRRFSKGAMYPRIFTALSLLGVLIVFYQVVLIAHAALLALALVGGLLLLLNTAVVVAWYWLDPVRTEAQQVCARLASARSALQDIEQRMRKLEADRTAVKRQEERIGKDIITTRAALETEERLEIQKIKDKLATDTRVTEQGLKQLQAGEQNELTRLQRSVQANLHRIDTDLASLISQEMKELQARLDALREASIEAYLLQHNVLSDQIYGIGRALRNDLFAHGFRTARDINLGVSRIYGIGDVRTHTLMAWRNSTLAAAAAQAPTNLPAGEQKAIKHKYEATRANLQAARDAEQQRQVTEELVITSRYGALRKRLEDEKQRVTEAADQQILQLPQKNAPHYARLDDELNKISVGFAPQYKAIDDRLVELKKERFECTWRIGMVERELDPYKGITLLRFLGRVYMGR
jgi:hypothetical protein